MTSRETGIFILPFFFYFLYIAFRMSDNSLFILFSIMASVFALIALPFLLFEEIKSIYFFIKRIIFKRIGRHIQLEPKEIKRIWREIHGKQSARALYRRYIKLIKSNDPKYGNLEFKSRSLWMPPRFFEKSLDPKPKDIGIPKMLDVYYLENSPSSYYVDVSFLPREFYKESYYTHLEEEYHYSKFRKSLPLLLIISFHLVLAIILVNLVN